MSSELVKQVAELRAMAGRARRLSANVSNADAETILAYAKELEGQAARLEAQLGAGTTSPVVHEQQQAETQTPDKTEPKA